MKSHDGEQRRSAPARAYRMDSRAQAVVAARERVLQATYELWLAKPYDEVTIDAVAEKAGVTRQTVHRQFGSKEDLVMAVGAWRAPRENSAREVQPGDVAAAVKRIIERNEEMGDANIRMLELEGRVAPVDQMLAVGRASHRAWIEQVFAPLLPKAGRLRATAIDALYGATDVTVWKLYRRDFSRTAMQTEAAMRLLVEGVLAQVARQSGKAER